MKLKDAASKVLSQCMGFQSEEDLLVVCDEKTTTIGQSLFAAALPISTDTTLLQISTFQMTDGEPPPLVTSALLKTDVAVCPTTHSLTHSEAVKKAYTSGTRVATMPGINEDILIRTMNADYSKVRNRSQKIAQILNESNHIKISSSKGTNLSFSIKGRKSIADFGILTKKGSIGNLPAGEAFIAPLEDSINGKAVVDGSITSIGKVKDEITVEIEEGSVFHIEGESEAEQLNKCISAHGEGAKMVGEFGIGTNDAAIISGNPLEDEKVLGTIHIALGKNSSFGGSIEVDIHLDCIIKRPSVFIDGEEIMKNGVLNI